MLAYSALAKPLTYLVFFDYGRSDTTPAGRKIINAAADHIKSLSNGGVAVIGHSDAAEAVEYPALSLERARYVAAALVTFDVPSDRILYVAGVGDAKPLAAPRADAEGREPENRRVQINILEKGQRG